MACQVAPCSQKSLKSDRHIIIIANIREMFSNVQLDQATVHQSFMPTAFVHMWRC